MLLTCAQACFEVGEAPREQRDETQLEHERVEEDLDELRRTQRAPPLPPRLVVVNVGRPEGRDLYVWSAGRYLGVPPTSKYHQPVSLTKAYRPKGRAPSRGGLSREAQIWSGGCGHMRAAVGPGPGGGFARPCCTTSRCSFLMVAHTVGGGGA